jgi:hypothetical protein
MGVSTNIIYHIKNLLGVAGPSSNQCAWGSIIFEDTVLGDTADTAPPGFFLSYYFLPFLLYFYSRTLLKPGDFPGFNTLFGYYLCR